MKLWVFDSASAGYEEYDGFVVIAPTEQRARELFSFKLSDEQRSEDFTCHEVDLSTEPEGILMDSYLAG